MAELLDRILELSPQKLALYALELQRRLDALEQARREPIAVVGMACRFPGGATDTASFWQLLRDGVDAIKEVPPDRWDVDAYYNPDPANPGTMYTRWGGFLDRVDEVDATFFNISPREAARMDPQQRLLLEVSWEAFEHAGLPADSLFNSQTGVFIGCSGSDYQQLLGRSGDPAHLNMYALTGTALNAVAGRVAFTFGLQGPCLVVDTACSSSLVAVHLASQSLRLKECDLALAGGVNLILTPDAGIVTSQARMMAADGRCKTFDAAADGFVRGEGCGVLLLKRLSDALASGDRILAQITGSAVNQDGSTSGFTVPNGLAQERLIRKALAESDVAPAAVSYVEAHGTGTPLGDPIEVQALKNVLGAGRKGDQPLAIGSVKTNIGHLEAAAGIAGLIKVVLALQHKEIPPHLHLRRLNAEIELDGVPLVIPTERTPWPSNGQPRVAGVSSFGASGTNAHVVVEEAPAVAGKPNAVERPVHLLALSARSQAALEELAQKYRAHLAGHANQTLADLCYTANSGRAHFAHRLAIAAGTAGELEEALAAFVAGAEGAALTGQAPAGQRPKVAFLFTGQGAQYAGMGRELYATSPTFRAALDECAALLTGELEAPLLEVLFGEKGELLDETAYTQPALFALEYALAQLWQSWGVTPDLVLGHSVGEYVAAVVAGVFSLADGLKLISARSRLKQDLAEPDALAALAQVAGQVAYRPPAVAFVSNLTGRLARGEEASQAEYWVGHIREPVRFAEGIQALAAAGCTAFVEVGPGTTLLSLGRQSVTEPAVAWLPSLRRG
ncbi:MAG: type I polyketide synthase, partial [Chloroflexi bacterium]|nr:type I polyketide synthase [Chloroflexota bacterium]